MPYSPLLIKAINRAAKAHEGKPQKASAEQTPYVAHVFAVGLLLHRAGFLEEVVAAGLLHDVLEDTPVTSDDLRREFGESVTRLVEAVTEPEKALPWEERKRRYREHLKEAPIEAVAISAADKLCNMEAILQELANGHDVWSKFKRGRDVQVENFRALAEVIRSRLELMQPQLVEEYGNALNRLEASDSPKVG